MKFAIVLACSIIAICVNGAPQAGPPLNHPWDSYAEHCQPPPCPANGNVNVSFPLDCVQYVECNDGIAKARACPDDTFWNNDAGKCTGRETTPCKQCW